MKKFIKTDIVGFSEYRMYCIFYGFPFTERELSHLSNDTGEQLPNLRPRRARSSSNNEAQGI